jgi:uncharacterized protein
MRADLADLKEKQRRLAEILGRLDGLVVAFSGGVDSTFLLAAAKRVLGDRVAAVTAASPVHPGRETREAAALAARIGAPHHIIASGEMRLPEFTANPPERCYVCKRHVLAEVFRAAEKLGIRHVAHGANADDPDDYRPGLAAAAEMGALAPLLEAGLTKAEIRRLSRRMKLPTWNKPARACLASRIPYGTPITARALAMVEAAEEYLEGLGFALCRVRCHGEVARIELDPRGLKRLMRSPQKADIVQRLRSIGFRHVALDLEGYVPGSLNRGLEPGVRGAAGA